MTENEILQKTDKIEQAVREAFAESFPMTVDDYIFDVENVHVVRPKMFDLNNELDLKDNGNTLQGKVTGNIIVKDGKGKVLERSKERLLMNVPYLTNRGTYIIGGKEKVIAKQMRLKPGVYTTSKDDNVESFFFLERGKNITIKFDTENLNLTLDINSRTFNAITFLRILGISDTDIAKAMDDPQVEEQLFKKASNKNMSTEIQKLWTILPSFQYLSEENKRKYPGEEAALKDIRDYFFNISSFGDTGSKVMKSTLGYSSTNPDKEVFLKAINKVIKIAKLEDENDKDRISDDKDDIRFQNVLDDDYQIKYYVSKGIEEVQKDIRRNRRNIKDNKANSYKSRIASAPLYGFMAKGSLVDLVEQTNPLLMSAAQRKITSLGEGGLSQRSATQETRNLQNSTFGKLDPVETPESGKIGLISHLTHTSRIDDLTIKSKYYKVTNGMFKTTKGNMVELEPFEEYDTYIGFFDPNTVKVDGTSGEVVPSKVWARHQGRIEKVTKDKIKYIDTAPHAIWGDATAMIPFNAHNDGNRMLMGSNMQKQALNLLNREAPLVQSAVDMQGNDTFEKKVARENSFLVHSNAAGTVTKVSEDNITVKDSEGKLHKHPLMNYFPLNMSNFINNEPTIKEGDTVKKGQLIADGWQTRDGALALGVNARIAYMPWKGYNFEDGYVISESFARKMTTEETKEIEVDIGEGQIGGPGSNVKSILARLNVPRNELDKLDDNGVIKKGENVESNTILVGVVEEIKEFEDKPEYRFLRAIGTEVQRQYKDKSKVSLGYMNGKVTRVKLIPGGRETKFTVKITILMNNPMKEGDKLAGRFGNKGIVTRIERDEDMPKAEDGQPIDVIYSPLGVPSRKNLGQLYEANAGLVASKTGKPFIVYNFDRNEPKRVEEGLKEIGFPDGKMTLYDPETGKPYENRVTVGVGYMMKLKHKVDDKLQARNIGKTNFIYNMPMKSIGDLAGEKGNPQRLGEMEIRALEASKAVNIIDEATKIKSDAAGDQANRMKIMEALAFGGLYNVAGDVPQSLRLFKDYSTAMGLNVKPMQDGKELQTLDARFNSLMISPIKENEVKRLSRGAVVNDRMLKGYKKGDQPEEGGLFDPSIFGETESEKKTYWGHIDLAAPMPNPLFMSSNVNPYAILLDLKNKDLDEIVTKNKAVVTDPGDSGLEKNQVVTLEEIDKLEDKGKTFKYEFSGFAIGQMLKGINIDKELKKAQDELMKAKPKDRAQYYRKIRVLNMLKNNNMKPEDLLIKKLPVLPVGLRPISRDASGRQIEEDMNELYRKLIQTNNELESVRDAEDFYFIDKSLKVEAAKDLYKRLEGVMGVNTQPLYRLGTSKDKELQGVIRKMKGKEGLIRGRLMSKQLDYSGRSVLTVNPSMKLDQAGLPVDIAVKLYQPFVMRELFRTQKARTQTEALEMSKNPNIPATWEALNKVVQERPVLLNRAPSLHKYSIQAFDPVLTKSRSIELNPLIVKGFNADFDGDQMAVHIPLTPEAVRESNLLLKPSKTLINPTNGQLITPIQGEAILGLYYLTVDKYKGKMLTRDMSKKHYMNYNDLMIDYKKGDMTTYDIVEVNGVVATVGQHLVNRLLPEQYRDYRRILTGKEVTKMIEAMIKEDEEKGRNKHGGTQVAVVTLDALKELGFLAATKSAMSIGIFDLKENKNRTAILDNADKLVEDNPGNLVSVYQEVEKQLQSQLNESLGKDNSMFAFMTSGAKGKKDQVVKMTDIVGLGRDITGKIQPVPIVSSLKEGLSPAEMWTHTFDSRRGMADRSLSVAKPGELTRKIWSSTQDIMITMADCERKGIGLSEGIPVVKSDKAILGRYLGKDVTTKDGTTLYRRNTLVTQQMKDAMAKAELDTVYVRSPLTCKAASGVCQKCYGLIPGTAALPPVGEPVGILASQAIGEPTAQGTMKTFHAGGIGKTTSLGFPRVIELFNMSDNPKYKATLSPINGKVTSVTREVVNSVITISGIDEGKQTTKNIKVPLVKNILVQPGDYVEKGQKIAENKEFVGTYSPHELLKYKGIDDVKHYVTNELANALEDNDIDRKHLELAISSLTDKVEVEDNSTSPWLPGSIVKRNVVDTWNAQNVGTKSSIPIYERAQLLGCKSAKTYKGLRGNVIVREGEVLTADMLDDLERMYVRAVDVYPNKVSYNPLIFGVVGNPKKGSDNWFSEMGFQDIKSVLTEGAAFGKEDLLVDPRSRQMAGKLVNIGEGYNKWHSEFDRLKRQTKQKIFDLFD